MDEDIRKRLDKVIENSKDINFVGKLSKSPMLVKTFYKMFKVLPDKDKVYVRNCYNEDKKINFKEFSEEGKLMALPYLEKILRKVNK